MAKAAVKKVDPTPRMVGSYGGTDYVLIGEKGDLALGLKVVASYSKAAGVIGFYVRMRFAVHPDKKDVVTSVMNVAKKEYPAAKWIKMSAEYCSITSPASALPVGHYPTKSGFMEVLKEKKFLEAIEQNMTTWLPPLEDMLSYSVAQVAAYVKGVLTAEIDRVYKDAPDKVDVVKLSDHKKAKVAEDNGVGGATPAIKSGPAKSGPKKAPSKKKPTKK